MRFKLGISATESHKEAAPAKPTIFNWFREFCHEGEASEEAEQVRTTRTAELILQVEELM